MKGDEIEMLGENILKLRKSKGLSQEQLGEHIDVTRQTISNWELGETSPNPEQLKLLSKVLSISVDELLDNDEKNILIQKVNNTEKLSKTIINILKVIGVLVLIMILIVIANIAIFTYNNSSGQTYERKMLSIEETLSENTYIIEIGDDGMFECYIQPSKIKEDLLKVIDFSNLDKTESNIHTYFSDLRDEYKDK